MIELVVNHKSLSYNESTHEYIVDGIAVPSVTQIVRQTLDWQYTDIDPMVLKRAADLGTALHKEIESFEKNHILGRTREFNNYLVLKKRHGFEVVDSERIIFIEKNGQVLCAGRLDMIVHDSNKDGLVLADIKRTYSIHPEHLMLQLNLYRIGYRQCYGFDIDRMVCIHLRNHVHEVIQVPIDEAFAWDKLHSFVPIGE